MKYNYVNTKLAVNVPAFMAEYDPQGCIFQNATSIYNDHPGDMDTTMFYLRTAFGDCVFLGPLRRSKPTAVSAVPFGSDNGVVLFEKILFDPIKRTVILFNGKYPGDTRMRDIGYHHFCEVLPIDRYTVKNDFVDEYGDFSWKTVDDLVCEHFVSEELKVDNSGVEFTSRYPDDGGKLFRAYITNNGYDIEDMCEKCYLVYKSPLGNIHITEFIPVRWEEIDLPSRHLWPVFFREISQIEDRYMNTGHAYDVERIFGLHYAVQVLKIDKILVDIATNYRIRS